MREFRTGADGVVSKFGNLVIKPAFLVAGKVAFCRSKPRPLGQRAIFFRRGTPGTQRRTWTRAVKEA